MISSLRDIQSKHIFMVGIKGTGMAALAHYFTTLGAQVSGSDSHESFYTDTILQALGIHPIESRAAKVLPKKCDMLIYSAAYSPARHPQLVAAAKRGLKLYSYPQIIGHLSTLYYSAAVAGVHGKTTISGLCATIVKQTQAPGTVLIGGAIHTLGGMPLLMQGNSFLVAETCEYRRHFHNFHPSIAVISSIEWDHNDYFTDIEDIKDAFAQFALRISPEGKLIYCADDLGAKEIAEKIPFIRSDIQLIPYGHSANGDYRIIWESSATHNIRFRLQKWNRHTFQLNIPGHHSVLNAAAAIALYEHLPVVHKIVDRARLLSALQKAIKNYRGASRRCEVIGHCRGITIIDDYAHHPTAIQKTLDGLREFYKPQRIVVDFMPHTYSRTAALLNEFAVSFKAADIVYINDIYASAREGRHHNIHGKDLWRAVSQHHQDVRYYPKYIDVLNDCVYTLDKGDIFVTLGAGNNWKLGESLLEKLTQLVSG